MFTFSFHLLKDFYCTTHTLEEAFNGSEAKTGQSVSMLNHNLFYFAFASSIYDFEELTTVIIQARGNLRTV